MKIIKKSIVAFIILCASISSASSQIAAVDVDKGTEKSSVDEVVIVFKMHFDIGYTDWAESILQKYTTSMMDETLRSVKETETLPPEDRFVWTLPGWPMKYMLENVSDIYKPALDAALKTGRFKVHALPFTFETESSDLETLVRGMNFSSQINRQYGFPLPRGAKLTDVPSHSWILPTLLTHAGVKFLHIGCNSGSTSPDVPTLFWWEGPDGSRLLTFNWAEYYGSGVLPPANWPYKTWLAMIHTHENTGAPKPEEVAAVLKEAREKLPNAKIRIGQLEDFYDALMKENPELPVIRGDMPDTWIHGYMSMPSEVKKNKSLQRSIYVEEALNTQLRQWGVEAEPVIPYVDKAVEQTLLFDEHSFGLAMSHGHQASWKYGDDFWEERALGNYDFIETSWYEKGDHVHKAEQLVIPSLRKDLKRLASQVAVDGKKVVVYNPLPWERSGQVNLFMDVYQKGFKVYGLRDEQTGQIIPAANDGNDLSFFARKVPSMGYKTYSVLTNPIPEVERYVSIHEGDAVIENRFFKVKINPENGALVSVWDKRFQKEMVNPKSEYGFGEYVHEKFGNDEIDRYNNSYVKPGHHGWADPEMTRPKDEVLQYAMEKGKVRRIKYDKTSHSVRATVFCQTEAGDDYLLSYALEDYSPYVEINWSLRNKPADPQPEAGWLVFPFNVDEPTFRLGRTGGVVNPVVDFIKNTNHDYFFVNTGLAVINGQGDGFGLNTPNAPAISLDRPGLFRFSGSFVPQRSNVFVNLFNNQWGTNFTEWIEGGLSAKMYLWSVSSYGNEKSLITPIEETRTPLLATYVEGKGGLVPRMASGITLSKKGILLTAYGPNRNGDGDVLRLWEQAGETGKCIITIPSSAYHKAQPCNLRGEPIGEPLEIRQQQLEVDIRAYQPLSLILLK